MCSRFAKTPRVLTDPTANYIFADLLCASNNLLEFTFSVINSVRLQNHFRERTRRAGEAGKQEADNDCNFWFTFDFDIKMYAKQIESACRRTRANLKLLRVVRIRTPFDTLDINMTTKSSIKDFCRKVKTLNSIVARFEDGSLSSREKKKKRHDSPSREEERPAEEEYEYDELEDIYEDEDDDEEEIGESDEEAEEEYARNKSGNSSPVPTDDMERRTDDTGENEFSEYVEGAGNQEFVEEERRYGEDTRYRKKCVTEYADRKADQSLTKEDMEIFSEISHGFTRICTLLTTAMNHILENKDVSDSMLLIPTSSSTFTELREILKYLRSLTRKASRPKPRCFNAEHK